MALTIFSVDYDGCGQVLDESTLLGKQNSEGIYRRYLNQSGFLTGMYSKEANTSPVLVCLALQLRMVLEMEFCRFLGDGNAEVYVGSNRQSAELDDHNAKRNLNGSCFEVFSNYFKDKRILLRPLLMADVEQGNVSNPIAMRDALDANQTLHLRCQFDKLKGQIIIAQLQDIARNHPNEDINFVMFDDDKENAIFPHVQQELKKAFEDKILSATLPKKFTVHLFKFEWNPLLKKNLANSTLCPIDFVAEKTMKLMAKIQFEAPLSQAEHRLEAVTEELTQPNSFDSSLEQMTQAFESIRFASQNPEPEQKLEVATMATHELTEPRPRSNAFFVEKLRRTYSETQPEYVQAAFANRHSI